MLVLAKAIGVDVPIGLLAGLARVKSPADVLLTGNVIELYDDVVTLEINVFGAISVLLICSRPSALDIINPYDMITSEKQSI
jgi:hypothetical protein